jgi:hypothetical protein
VTSDLMLRVRSRTASLSDQALFGACLAGLAIGIGVFLTLRLAPDLVPMHRLPTNHDVHIQGKDQGGVSGFWFLSVPSYLVALWLWRRGRRPSWRLLVLGAVLLHLLSLLVPPVASEDVYAYSFYGAVQRDYGINPYLAFPDQHPLHPWFPFWSWRDVGPVYGAPFVVLLRLVAVLAGPSLLAWVLWMKVLLVAFEAVGIWLLVRALTPLPRAGGALAGPGPAPGPLDRPGPPHDRGWPVLLIAWNPMVLQSVAMSAHVDALLLMVFGGAVLAHIRGRHLAAFVLLVAGFNVKLYIGPVAALYGFWIAAGRPRGQRIATVLRLGGLGTAITAVACLPFASAGWRLASSVLDVGGHYSSGSIGNFVRRLLPVLLEPLGVSPTAANGIGDQTGRVLALGAVLVWFAFCAARVRARRDPLPLLATYFLGYLLLTPWVFYWHELPLLGLVAVIPFGLTSMVTIVLGLTLMPASAPVRAVVQPAPGDARQLVNTITAFLARYGAACAMLGVGLVRARWRWVPRAPVPTDAGGEGEQPVTSTR